MQGLLKGSSFCGDEDGNINLWKLYNLLTGNKRSYIDIFLDRSVNAFSFSEQLRLRLKEEMKAGISIKHYI